ncbi:hypothetical protein A2316_01455 [Candidatus Falkowbacteria bacterium RIFOXYB2_FULL_38_15]|uniref:Steroid 5-alpha reductase C-terminal domain-containing protein n=1 Tax=Candidatus Falkowbacteria bacterium RIFOXYA2_FULL_38_12 TaxID=1797993 RepID=A0A1F5S1F1_9BACT|nr:MAG: hypothetical protein A2257_03885 [Candidatus Falkowbacteria bacterium RIFOXYA2_FULL_38_12]OGF32905.1 MAG: hypothetical protein A2316_01455 [Candidatus Falkowbacteria bacterium RIFOXYB2_FULL_38_15]
MIKKFKKMKKIVNPIIMWLIIIVGAIVIFVFVGDDGLFISGIFNKLILIIAFLFWLYFFISAVYIHKQVIKSAEKINKIIDVGVYSIVRHPIYMADVILAWGVFIAFPNLRVFVAVIYSTIIWFAWMKLEEKVLIDKFGQQYSEYARKVPMIIPRIRKNNR